MALYGSILIDPSQGGMDGRVLADTYEKIAYTNHVKCSPEPDLGRPTPAMLRVCGAHLLAGEVALLQPGTILILGAQHFSQAVGAIGGEALFVECKGASNGDVRAGHIGDMEVFGVPHPNRGKAISFNRAEELRQAVLRLRDSPASPARG